MGERLHACMHACMLVFMCVFVYVLLHVCFGPCVLQACVCVLGCACAWKRTVSASAGTCAYECACMRAASLFNLDKLNSLLSDNGVLQGLEMVRGECLGVLCMYIQDACKHANTHVRACTSVKRACAYVCVCARESKHE